MFLIWLPETLASKLLRDKAARLNKQNQCDRYLSPADKDRGSVWSTLVSQSQLMESGNFFGDANALIRVGHLRYLDLCASLPPR